MKRRSCLFIILLISKLSLAQDSHFSQYLITKSFLNPSLIGYQNSDYQIQLQRRSQWESVTRPFVTFSLALNKKNFFKNFSLASYIINDKAGDTNLSTSGIGLTVSNKSFLTENQNFSLGFSLGYYQKALDYSALFFFENEDVKSYSVNYIDLSLGIVHEQELLNNLTLLTGLATFHINNPNQSFFENNSVKLKNNNKFHAGLIYYYSSNLQFNPDVYYSFQGTTKEIVFGLRSNYLISSFNEPIVIRSGLLSRYKDAIIPVFGLKIDNFDIMTSYDINISSLSNASDYKGGFEFGIIYNWNTEKTPIYNDRLTCPKYL